jgi:diguanylate cyclase (GGDEF)-like protein
MADSETPATPTQIDELTRFIRSTTAIELLCLALSALILLWSPQLLHGGRGAGIAMGLFAALIVAFRARRFFPRQTRVKIAIESITMIAYVTAMLWMTGKTASPLLNLYLLPIILSALTLGRTATLLQVALIGVCHMLLASTDAALGLSSLTYASLIVGELAPFLLVAYLTTTLSADISEARQNLESLAQSDALSGALNLRAFNRVWQQQHRQTENSKGQYCLLMIDIDKLKSINDSYGQDAGDSAIVLVSQCIQRSIRSTDSLGRVSGDEFAVLLPGATGEVADVVVNRVRHNVYNTTLDLRSRMIRCSVSIGVVNYPKDGRDMRELSNLSDRRMIRDKELRRPPGQQAAG